MTRLELSDGLSVCKSGFSSTRGHQNQTKQTLFSYSTSAQPPESLHNPTSSKGSSVRASRWHLPVHLDPRWLTAAHVMSFAMHYCCARVTSCRVTSRSDDSNFLWIMRLAELDSSCQCLANHMAEAQTGLAAVTRLL